jgi:hypothetical protein
MVTPMALQLNAPVAITTMDQSFPYPLLLQLGGNCC